MSATGIERTRAASGLRRIAANVAAGLALLVRTPPPGVPARRWPSIGTLAGVGVLIGAAVVASMAWVDGRAIAGAGQLPSWIVRTFDELTDFGKSGWLLWPIGLMLVAIAALSARELRKPTQGVMLALAVRLSFLFAAIALPGIAVSVVKRVIGRARPLVEGSGDVFIFKPFVWQVEYAGLPSGHTTTAFAAAVAFGALWPRMRPLMWTYAVVIAVSRIVVTAHYPSDAIAGAAFGAVGALLVRDWFAARRLGFTVTAEGMVRPLPGPSFRRTKAVARRLLSA